MIEQDGDETVYPVPYQPDPMRRMLEAISPGTAARVDAMATALNAHVRCLMQPIRTVTPAELEAVFGPGGRFTNTFRMVGHWPDPKTYSPTRRWLRAERAREHQEAIAADVETVTEWRPSRAPAVEIASRLWRVPVSVGVDEDLPGSDRSVEIRYIGGVRYEMGETDPRPPSGGTGGGGFKGPFR